MKNIFAALVFLVLGALCWGQTSDDFFSGATLQRLDITMNATDWAKLKANFLDDTRYPAIFKWNNVTIEDIAIRSRGSGSRSPVKPGLKAEFAYYEPGQTFLGMANVVLRNNTQDASQMKERISMQFFSKMGLPASRETHARLYVNNEYIGLYTFVENVDVVYTKRYLNDDQGRLYEYKYSVPYHFENKGSDQSLYQPDPFKPETFKDHPDATVIAQTMAAINGNSGSGFQSALAPFLDLKLFLTHLSVESYLAEQDGLVGDYGANNFYFYTFAGKTLSQFLPWDKSNTFWTIDRYSLANFDQNILVKNAMAVPELKTFFLQSLLKAMQTAGGPGGWMAQEIDREYNQIKQAAYDDPNKQCLGSDGNQRPCTNADFEAGVQYLRDFANQRPSWVMSHLASQGLAVAKLSSSAPSTGLRFGAIAGTTTLPQTLTVTSDSGSLSYTATVTGAPWMTVTPAAGTTPATLNITVNPGSMSPGDYTGSISIASSGASNSPLSVPVTLSVLAAGSQPVLAAGGMVNAATSGTTLAAGALASIYGANLGSAATGAPSIPLPTELAGISIRVNNVLAPILFASSGQVNVEIPWETAPGSATITAAFKGVAGNSITTTIGTYAPGVFVTVYPDGGLVNGSKPAAANDILVVYANGLGPVTPSVPTGSGASVLTTTTATVTATIGGVDAPVLFSGLTPFVGLYQVNVRVPAGVTPGSATPLVLKVGGVSSPPNTIATR